MFSAACLIAGNDEYTHGSMIDAMTSTHGLVKYLDESLSLQVPEQIPVKFGKKRYSEL